jgi:Bacterial extracellular solute-binding proteins, family 3
MEWPFKLIPISDMESILSGLEQGRFDAAIGAITITPERAARVDFSYPAHRSGVAIATRKETGPLFAVMSYGTALAELSPLIIVILTLLVVIGLAMWIIERRVHSAQQASESSVVTAAATAFLFPVLLDTIWPSRSRSITMLILIGTVPTAYALNRALRHLRQRLRQEHFQIVDAPVHVGRVARARGVYDVLLARQDVLNVARQHTSCGVSGRSDPCWS